MLVPALQTRFTIQKLLEKKKQNICFVWNAASASDFRHSFYLLMISTKNPQKQQILLVLFAKQRVNHISLTYLEILFKNAVFIHPNTSQNYIQIRPCIFKLISVLYFSKSASGLPNSNSLWRGGMICPCSDQLAVHTEACSQTRILNLQKSFLKAL